MSEPGKQKLKALKRAQRDAARVYKQERAARKLTDGPAISTQAVAVDDFLQAYGELTDATVELYRRLDPQDSRRQPVRDALVHAGRAAAGVLNQHDLAAAQARAQDDQEVDAEVDVAAYLAAGRSVELVRVARDPDPTQDPSPSQNLPAVFRRAPRRWLPDESFLVRYGRVRRATHRWPDEAALARYLRERPLPDESTLRRYLQRRRELYQRYA